MTIGPQPPRHTTVEPEFSSAETEPPRDESTSLSGRGRFQPDHRRCTAPAHDEPSHAQEVRRASSLGRRDKCPSVGARRPPEDAVQPSNDQLLFAAELPGCARGGTTSKRPLSTTPQNASIRLSPGRGGRDQLTAGFSEARSRLEGHGPGASIFLPRIFVWPCSVIGNSFSDCSRSEDCPSIRNSNRPATP